MSNWKQLSPEQKREYLEKQMAEIRSAKALIARFEKVTSEYLKKIQAPTNKR
jgi:hypothetical protein